MIYTSRVSSLASALYSSDSLSSNSAVHCPSSVMVPSISATITGTARRYPSHKTLKYSKHNIPKCFQSFKMANLCTAHTQWLHPVLWCLRGQGIQETFPGTPPRWKDRIQIVHVTPSPSYPGAHTSKKDQIEQYRMHSSRNTPRFIGQVHRLYILHLLLHVQAHYIWVMLAIINYNGRGMDSYRNTPRLSGHSQIRPLVHHLLSCPGAHTCARIKFNSIECTVHETHPW